jgi:3-oxoacyl-[acyl-carrier-protein] synthase III
MTAVYVDHPSHALGEVRRTVEESAAAGQTFSAAADLRDAGFSSHQICGPLSTAYDLARRAVQPLGERLGRVDAIVYATCLPANGSMDDLAGYEKSRDVKHLMQYPASRLQADFSLDDAVVFGLNQQACTGMLGSLRMASALLRSEPEWHRVLCVTADRFPPGAVYEQAYNLISDGAAACVVSRDPHGFRLVAAHQVTNGAMVFASDDEVVGSYFSYTYGAIQRVLAKAGVSPADLAWVVPQNTNGKAWEILSRLLGIPLSRVYFPSMPEAAHVISGDNVINLEHLAASGRLRPGDKVLLVMAGYGMNWQCTVLERV